MKTVIFLPSLAFALLVNPAVSFAQPEAGPQNRPGMRREGGPERGPGDDRNRLRMRGRGPGAERQRGMMQLDLTEAQKSDLRKVRETARRDRLRKSTDLKIARMDLQSLMAVEKVDEKAVSAKLAEVQAAQGALLKLRVDTALAMKRILTPEQQKKISALRGNRSGRGQRMRGVRSRGMQRKQPGPNPSFRDDPSSDESVIREEV